MTMTKLVSPQSLPYTARCGAQTFELTQADCKSLSGVYVDRKTKNRFEVRVEHEDNTIEWFSVVANALYSGNSLGFTGMNCAFQIILKEKFRSISFEFKGAPELNCSLIAYGEPGRAVRPMEDARTEAIAFDVSDLIFYIGHHDNLTGIQRVQVCILLGLIDGCPHRGRSYLSFDGRAGQFLTIDQDYFEALLRDLFRPAGSRKIEFERIDARNGILPHSTPLSVQMCDGRFGRLIVCLLGAGWVNRDYFHRILDLKRKCNAVFCMTIHDLIPIYAKETCDQETAAVFAAFLRESFLFVDHYVAVSEYTASDLHKFASSEGKQRLPLSVVENGHSFDEFTAIDALPVQSWKDKQYVLFVSTVEGRKNHKYMFDVWAQLAKIVKDPPVLVCVGRIGWRAEEFRTSMLASNNSDNKIEILSDVSDGELQYLYENCLFTVYPSFYEGWGLPVGESLAKGKLCVTSDRSSIPEVAGPFAIYIDVESVGDGVASIQRLIEDVPYRKQLETKLRAQFVARSWRQVADDLVRCVSRIPRSTLKSHFPEIAVGRGYHYSNSSGEGGPGTVIAGIGNGQPVPDSELTGFTRAESDLVISLSTRLGPNWCMPENWGTWSRYPTCERLFYVQWQAARGELVICESLRVVRLLVGSTLRVVVNRGNPQEFKVEAERFCVGIAIPEVVEADGVVEVLVHYELVGKADVIPRLEQIDSRRLGVGFESTFVMDSTDLTSRVLCRRRGSDHSISRDPRFTDLSRIAAIDGEGTCPKLARLLANGSDALNDQIGHTAMKGLQLELGESISCKLDGENRAVESVELLLGGGWFPMEETGVWSSGRRSTLRFHVSHSVESAFVLGLDMRCLATAGVTVNVLIAINNVVLFSKCFIDSKFGVSQFVVDGGVRASDRAYSVLIHCDKLRSPAAIGESVDARDLGVQVRELRVDALFAPAFDLLYQVNSDSEISRALSGGWYPVEPMGIWCTEGGGRLVAAVNLAPESEQMGIRIGASCRVFGTWFCGASQVDLVVMGRVAASWGFEDDAMCFKQATVPLQEFGERCLLDMRFIRRGVSPAPSDLGIGTDRRRLGIFISTLSFARV